MTNNQCFTTSIMRSDIISMLTAPWRLRLVRVSSARLIKKVFESDPLTGNVCANEIPVRALNNDNSVIRHILGHVDRYDLRAAGIRVMWAAGPVLAAVTTRFDCAYRINPIVANPDASLIAVGASLLANLSYLRRIRFASKLAPTVQVLTLTARGV